MKSTYWFVFVCVFVYVCLCVCVFVCVTFVFSMSSILYNNNNNNNNNSFVGLSVLYILYLCITADIAIRNYAVNSASKSVRTETN